MPAIDTLKTLPAQDAKEFLLSHADALQEKIPAAYRWNVLASKSGIELKKFYKTLLADLGENSSRRIRQIYQGASTNIDEPKKS